MGVPKKYIIGTTWDIKNPSINSPYKNLAYFKNAKDEDGIKYWTALINMRLIQRKFLDAEWNKNKSKVKNEEDFRTYVKDPADEKAEKFFKRDSGSLHTGDFGEDLIDKYSKRKI